jgi:hypothetical protein
MEKLMYVQLKHSCWQATETKEVTPVNVNADVGVLRGGLTCTQSMRLPRIGSSLSCSERSWLIS